MLGLCAAIFVIQQQPEGLPPLLPDGTGTYHAKVRVAPGRAKQYFDQGLAMLYAFHKKSAERSFAEAARLDPKCAMAWWGAAMALGPDINFVDVDEATSKQALDYLAKAEKVSVGPTEKALVKACQLRFKLPAPKPRLELDKAYSDAMGALYAKHPNDPDIASLYAESVMILMPWSTWTPDGKLKKEAQPAMDAVRRALRICPTHLMANHLMVHLTEGTARPQDGLVAADRLCEMTPRLGHLVHMPSHTYVRTGDWARAVVQNEKALASDSHFFSGKQAPYPYLVYVGHNRSMLMYAATMIGDEKKAMDAAMANRELVPEPMWKDMADVADAVVWAKFDLLKRFGRWDAMLAEPEPPEYLPFSRAMFFGNRTIALAAKGEIKSAMVEFDKYRAAARAVKPDEMIFTNKAQDILKVMDGLVGGELAIQGGQTDAGLSMLRDAVKAEDQLNYDEPPDWMQPVRHTLGAALIRVGRPDEAVAVYQEDLRKLPRNGWSLFGLYQAYAKLGDKAESARYRKQFDQVWVGEVPSASCLCLPVGK